MRINKEIVAKARGALLAVLASFVFFQTSCFPSGEETMYCQNDSQNSKDPRQYYATHGIMTDPGKHLRLYDALPSEIPELRTVAQGLLVNVFHARSHGLELSEERSQEVGIRKVADMLERMIELDSSPLDRPREPVKRLVGNCRGYAVLMSSFLRHKKIPARARPGFATYLLPGSYEDHWICEYWNQAEKRWVQVEKHVERVTKYNSP